jgi:hypothetical protein
MIRTKRVLIALLIFGAMAAASFPAVASVRMKVTGQRTSEPIVMYVTPRATLLATGHYAEALGLPPPTYQYDYYYGGYDYGGPVYYGHYPPCAGYGCGYPVPVTPPAYQWGHSPLDPPLPIPY